MNMEFEREESRVSSSGSALFHFHAFPSAVPPLGTPGLLPPFLHQLALIIWPLLIGLLLQELLSQMGSLPLAGGLTTYYLYSVCFLL